MGLKMKDQQEKSYKTSGSLQITQIGNDDFVIANGMFGNRQLVGGDIVEVLASFKKQPLTSSEFQKMIDQEDEANNVFFFLKTNYFIVPADENELDLLKSTITTSENNENDQAFIWKRFYGETAKETFKTLRTHEPYSSMEKKKLNVFIVGGCLSQYLDGILQPLGRSFGLEFDITSLWPENLDSLLGTPDIIAFQPGIMSLLEPTWDHFPFLSIAERKKRVADLKTIISLKIKQILSKFENSLILIQGISRPILEPLGRVDFRESLGFEKAIFEINESIKEQIASKTNAFYIDEEKLFSIYGKLPILDDHLVPFSHHGPIDTHLETAYFPGKTIKESFNVQGTFIATKLLAEEIINYYLLWSGRGKIKLIVVDLDQTLWPGIIGEGTADSTINNFKFLFEQTPYGGLHQALKILKNRGVLLASCSKNDEKSALEFWNHLAEISKSEGLDHIFLNPGDFVIHKINWNQKSQNIMEIARQLEVDLRATLFIDDSHVEREEVRYSCPQVRILGEDLNKCRMTLLNDPNLQVNVVTKESAQRTEMVKSQLMREAERSVFKDESEFLRTLKIKVHIKKCQTEAEFNRACELIQRSTQFNTSQKKYGTEALRKLGESDGAVYVMEAEDKYTKYGLVAVCVLKGSQVDSFVMSCRVIGIKVAVPFLVKCLQSHVEKHNHWKATIVPTERNVPCRELFTLAGFKKEKENIFSLTSLKALVPVDATIYDMRVDLAHGDRKKTA